MPADPDAPAPDIDAQAMTNELTAATTEYQEIIDRFRQPRHRDLEQTLAGMPPEFRRRARKLSKRMGELQAWHDEQHGPPVPDS